MKKRFNPDELIGALEAVLEKFNVTMSCRRFTGDVVLYNRNGMEVCSFNGLTARDGPTNLEIGMDYISTYSTEAK